MQLAALLPEASTHTIPESARPLRSGFGNEPNVEPALIAMKNVVLTPHLGSAVNELRVSMANVVADNIIAVLEGRQPPNCWNPEIYK